VEIIFSLNAVIARHFSKSEVTKRKRFNFLKDLQGAERVLTAHKTIAPLSKLQIRSLWHRVLFGT
jgi:hypothetical protein